MGHYLPIAAKFMNLNTTILLSTQGKTKLSKYGTKFHWVQNFPRDINVVPLTYKNIIKQTRR